MPVRLIAHALIEKDGKFLLIKRSKIKRGIPNVFPSYWDIPGGSVEKNELPREGAIRESLEEVNQKIHLHDVIYEDSRFDIEKQVVFTRLVYNAYLTENREVQLDPEEHTDYRWVSSLDEMKDE